MHPETLTNGTPTLQAKEKEYHGGQEWNTENFVCDFSVTTNMYGPPQEALECAMGAVSET